MLLFHCPKEKVMIRKVVGEQDVLKAQSKPPFLSSLFLLGSGRVTFQKKYYQPKTFLPALETHDIFPSILLKLTLGLFPE